MKLETPPGVRDFLPEEMAKRQEVIDRIRRSFELYGFSPAETPAFEYAELLENKYGEDEKLIYKFEDLGGRKLALRYDLTVPLVRLAGMNQLPSPFKRYCIARVWRFDRPQKGRYREFWQCDVDILGVKGPEADAEVLSCAIDALDSLGLKDYTLRINDRRLLDQVFGAMAKEAGCGLESVLRALDKLNKQGAKEVKRELETSGFSNDASDRILKLAETQGLDELKGTCPEVKGATSDIEEILRILKSRGKDECVKFDFSLARGLDYYTGPIFEVSLGNFGSIAGGGRYDNLIEEIAGKNCPAVGISLGIERIIEVMREAGMLEDLGTASEIYVLCADEKSKKDADSILSRIRSGGISGEGDLVGRNFSGQMKYANRIGARKVVIVGQKDLSLGKVTIKDMKEGSQELVLLKDLISKLKK